MTVSEDTAAGVLKSRIDSLEQVWKNVILECARFNSRNQQEGESAEKYITTLYELAASEMIRDRLVIGIKKSERLQMEVHGSHAGKGQKDDMSDRDHA